MTRSRKANGLGGDAIPPLPCSSAGFWWCVPMVANLVCWFSDLMTCFAPGTAQNVRSHPLEGATAWFCHFYWLKSEPWRLGSSCVGGRRLWQEERKSYLKYVNTPLTVYVDFYSSSFTWLYTLFIRTMMMLWNVYAGRAPKQKSHPKTACLYQ